MTKRQILLVLVGVGVASLGVLWSLQGAGAVHVRPVLCVSNCKPIAGSSPGWLVAGVAVLLAGLGVVWVELRHRNHRRR